MGEEKAKEEVHIEGVLVGAAIGMMWVMYICVCLYLLVAGKPIPESIAGCICVVAGVIAFGVTCNIWNKAK